MVTVLYWDFSRCKLSVTALNCSWNAFWRGDRKEKKIPVTEENC